MIKSAQKDGCLPVKNEPIIIKNPITNRATESRNLRNPFMCTSDIMLHDIKLAKSYFRYIVNVN